MRNILGIAVAFTVVLTFAGSSYADLQPDNQTLQTQAAQGDAKAQANLGWRYAEGLGGLPKDYAKAREWYEKAAEQGDANAQYSLGALYDKGKGVSQDYWEARQWYEKARQSFEKAAAKGDANAQYSLGRMYAEGTGVPQDYATARQWYEKAAAQDNKEAQSALIKIRAKEKQKEKEAVEPEAEKKEGAVIQQIKGASEEFNRFYKARYDPNDVVAQVLNYSSFGKEKGLGDGDGVKKDMSEDLELLRNKAFWYAKSKCVYAKAQFAPFFITSSYKYTPSFFPEMQTIDFDKVDPRTVKIGTGFLSTYFTVVIDGAEISSAGGLDRDRLQRGWSLIFSKYCQGAKKAF